MRHHLCLLCASTLLMTACGAGGGSGDPATGDTKVVTEYYADGRPAATGAVSIADAKRIGPWVEFHDAEGSPKRWEGAYADGTIDRSAYWCEWNADGSVRADQTDH